eukprot:4221647-Amphidinium_carterae.1
MASMQAIVVRHLTEALKLAIAAGASCTPAPLVVEGTVVEALAWTWTGAIHSVPAQGPTFYQTARLHTSAIRCYSTCCSAPHLQEHTRPGSRLRPPSC